MKAPRYPGTDKDWPHGYIPDYERIARDLRTDSAVCELGVHLGGSLIMWLDLFHQGTVVGVDVNPAATWPEGTHRVVMSQDDPALPEALSVISPGGYHLIVDDASHMPAQTQAAFESLWPLVVPGGYYVVEDWTSALGLAEWCPWLISAVYEGAATVTYTREGLVIVERARP